MRLVGVLRRSVFRVWLIVICLQGTSDLNGQQGAGALAEFIASSAPPSGEAPPLLQPPRPLDGTLQGSGSIETESQARTKRLGTQGGIFAKPFLSGGESRTYIGGYLDLEYRDAQGSNRSFRQHRFIPFIYSQVSEQVRVAAEIEFEDGGTDSEGDDGETKVEFAIVDWVPSEALGFRAGAILAPLGKFNLVHDSPANDLTDRPLLDTNVIPTTFTEAGAGIFGSFYPGEEGRLDYELYMVNGFDGLEADATSPTGFTSNLSTSAGTRDARPSLRTDNNNSIAGVGRVGYSPFLGAELGASAHAGRYDERADNTLVIWALDGIWVPTPPLELLGEVARAEIERDTLARASGVPDDFWGYYLQANYHFMPEALENRWPRIFGPESTFTAVARWDHIELDDERRQRSTLGLNFRPIEDTVFKFDYQFNYEDGGRNRVHNDAVLFSVATYF